MDNPVLLIAIAFFFGVIGLLVGAALGSMRRKKKDTHSVPEPEKPVVPPVPARNTPKDSVEILSVWRNERSGKLVAMLESKPISPTHMTGEQKDKLSQILSGLHSMAGDVPPVAPTPAIPPASIAPVYPEPASSAMPDQAVSPSPLEESPLASEPPPSGQAEKIYFADTLPEPVGLRQALTGNPFKINVPTTSQKPSNAPKSIVEQIDEIFQAKLAGTPYAEQNIQLKEAPNGMTILIGSYKYDGVDAVPDPAVRALIKEAAREWNENVSRRR